MNQIFRLPFLGISLLFLSCNSTSVVRKQNGKLSADTYLPKVVYKSGDFVITQLTENAFEHKSFLQTKSSGKVPCNGMIVRNSGEAVIFDTTSDSLSSAKLITWVKEKLNCKINAVVPTHFHIDNLGGLKAFEQAGIQSYANFKTIEFAKDRNENLPQNGFTDSLVIKVGNKKVKAKFFGEGHPRDNTVGYFPDEEILFGGCLIKDIDATKGNLADANENEWSNTVAKIKKSYPNIKYVIPGHGQYGNQKLLDYTVELFKKH